MYLPVSIVMDSEVEVDLHPASVHTQWMARIAKSRDMTAFEQLFGYFAPRVKTMLMKNSADPGVAEDLMQETMLTVWNKADQFSNQRGSVSSWIFTIARNKRIDRFRKQGIAHYTVIEELEIADDAPDSEDAVLSAERDYLVTGAVSKLPPEQREVVSMAYVEDLSQTEIAEKLGLPLGTVKSRLRLAYSKMKNELEGEL